MDDYDRIVDRLTVIMGYCELLENGAYGPVTREQSRVLKDLLDEAKKLAGLLRKSEPAAGSAPDWL
jgi:hypothetical protein